MTSGTTAALTLGTPGTIKSVNSGAARMEKITTGVTIRMGAGNTAPLRRRWVWMSRITLKLQFTESNVAVSVRKEDHDITGADILERKILGTIARQALNSRSTTSTARITVHVEMRSITGVKLRIVGTTAHQELLLGTSGVDTRLRPPLSLYGYSLCLWLSCAVWGYAGFLKGSAESYL